MKCGAVPVDRFGIVIGTRHLHKIICRTVKGVRPAYPEVGAGCFNEHIGPGQNKAQWNGRWRLHDMSRQL